jgi:hypothetical protein
MANQNAKGRPQQKMRRAPGVKAPYLKNRLFCILNGRLGSSRLHPHLLCWGVVHCRSSVAEEPHAPSANSTLCAIGILPSRPAVPLLRRPPSPAETPVGDRGSRNGLPCDSVLTDSMPVCAGGCVLRAGRGTSCAAGAGAGTGAGVDTGTDAEAGAGTCTGADASAGTSTDVGAGARDAAAAGAPLGASAGASSPPSVAASLPRRSSSEIATQPSMYSFMSHTGFVPSSKSFTVLSVRRFGYIFSRMGTPAAFLFAGQP